MNQKIKDVNVGKREGIIYTYNTFNVVYKLKSVSEYLSVRYFG